MKSIWTLSIAYVTTLDCCDEKGAKVDVGIATNGLVDDPTATLANGRYAELAMIVGL